jgi:hypothetical protein
MSTLKDAVERLCHAFMFKWKHNFTEMSGLHVLHVSHSTTICWNTFINTNRIVIDTFVNNSLKPIYSEHPTSTTFVNRVDVMLPDVAICEHMCYPKDKVIRMCGINDTETQQKMHIAITTFGTVICKTNTDTKIVKFGTIQYTDEIIMLIRQFRSNKSLRDWIQMLEELDILQRHIMLYQEIYNR